MSENQRRRAWSSSSFSTLPRTCLRESSLDVALFLVSTCAMNPPLKCEKPQARATHPRLRCLDDDRSLYRDAVRVLVTGGAGFIGSHFVKRMLSAGEDVVVLDKFTYAGNEANLPDGVDCRRGDIAMRDDVDQIGHVDADRKSTRLNSSHVRISYAVFCLKKKTNSVGPHTYMRTGPGAAGRSTREQ